MTAALNCEPVPSKATDMRVGATSWNVAAGVSDRGLNRKGQGKLLGSVVGGHQRHSLSGFGIQ